ncbi:MAG: Silent information regulator protein Sir2 [Hyphomicrobiales bacterium]|nr:Silent information regulator protein Sir2 [Hyphomicrobiales bacterium]
MKSVEQTSSRVELAHLLSQCGNAVAFTGAGISTECGVPDFRSPGSAWRRNKPIPFADFLASEDMRLEAWRRKFAMDDIYAGAKPGRGHAALQRLVASGIMSAVITQNIDGLHQQSGIPDAQIIELHGNGTYAHCLQCGTRHELAEVRAEMESRCAPPLCGCGGIVKSATISFGQAMPREAMQRAKGATLACDLFIAIGSSLLVQPAASFPLLAKQNGAALVIVNGEATPLDDQADLVLNGDIGDLLDTLGRDGGRFSSATSDGRPQDTEKTSL